MIKFIETYSPAHRWIEQDGIRKGELTRNNYGRSLWQIEIDGKRIVDAGSDCFSLTIAKQIVKRILAA